MAANKSNANLLNEMIQADRQKKKNEALAQRIFGKGPKKGVPPPVKTKGMSAAGASLASRVGVTKRSASAAPKPNIDGQWTHDLHDNNNVRRPRLSGLRTNSSSQLERGNRIAAGIQQESFTNGSTRSFNIRGGQGTGQMTIRGMASNGPYIVMASNFAPGTTAEDIEAAMLPVGGEIESCRIITARPTVMAEIQFVDRDGAENVVATFNNQKADGRVLYVFIKQGGPTPVSVPKGPAAEPKPATPRPVARNEPDRDLMESSERMEVDEGRLGPSDHRDKRNNGAYDDGRYGFSDPYDSRLDSRLEQRVYSAPSGPRDTRYNDRRGGGDRWRR